MLDREKKILQRIADTINPYSWITAIRNKAFDTGVMKSHEFGIATICIGNITVGGTGKTPHTEYLARLLKGKYRTAVLSRGYGRQSKGFVKAEAGIKASMIGDEPAQMKNKFPDLDVYVCEKRVDGIRNILSEKKGTDVILLDDAYQHRHVKAGLNILLIDSNRPLWQDCILPFGRLRESENGILRADVAIITKCGDMTEEEREQCRSHISKIKEIPVFFTAIRYGNMYRMSDTAPFTGDLKGSGILLVTGIANPAPLRKEIESQGAEIHEIRYPDHHKFSDSDISDIVSAYKSLETGGIIITTEKDAARIQQQRLPDDIKDIIYIVPIETVFLYDEENMFNQIIENYVTENSRNS